MKIGDIIYRYIEGILKVLVYSYLDLETLCVEMLDCRFSLFAHGKANNSDNFYQLNFCANN